MNNFDNQNVTPKKPITDEERLKLAQKLDQELDEFINTLPRKKYEDGWPEDRWEEEMEKHPFFMKKSPQPGDELHPLYQGLQNLKYDPEENEPHELAIAYKDDGNFNFKHKNYRLAIVAYTEGIKQNCGDIDIEANLLNNRAAAHWFLKNYRSCLRDCELALKLKPDYDKALNRAVKCCYELKQYQKAIAFCDQILDKVKDNKEILELRQMCVNEAKIKERNERKRQQENKKKIQNEKSLINEIIKRNYYLEGGNKGTISISQLEPCFPELIHNKVHIDNSSNSLVWPVVLVYPEYKIMDYIQEFNEEDSFMGHLNVVFESYPEWDLEKKYSPNNLNVYFETDTKKLIKIDVMESLGHALKTPGYIIKGGTPSFMVFVKNSEAEKAYLT